MAKVITMIMAGGQGARLYPLTRIRSKPAVPIAGRFRLIDFPISNCLHSSLRKIFVLTQFSSESLHRHIFLTYRFDNFTKDFITVLSAQQTLDSKAWYQGTADAVRQNMGFLRSEYDLVLILSGDHLYRMDYRRFIESHLSRQADISISVYPVTCQQAPEFGVMKVDKQGRILDFLEKPRSPEDLDNMCCDEECFARFGMEAAGRSHLASMGVYIFRREVLEDLLKESTAEDFGRQIIPAAIRRNKVFAHFFDGYWEDIGTIRSFFDAHMDLTRPLPRFNLYDEDRPIFTHARFLPGSKILKSEISDSILCEGSIINRSRIRNSIAGIRSRIGEGCDLDRTVLMGANLFESGEEQDQKAASGIPPIGIGKNCLIRDAIIDRNARIGRNVQLVNSRGITNEQGDAYAIVDGIIVIPKNAVLPDDTVI